MSGTLEARIEALETTIAFQDQSIEDLNEALGLQAKEIDSLKHEIARLSAHLRDISSHPALAPEEEPPPPHY